MNMKRSVKRGSSILGFVVWQSLVRGIGLLFVLCALSGARVAAQATSGVTGVVTDSSGAIIVGAEVKLTNASTGFSATTKTNDAGIFQFLLVPPGENYTLSFSSPNFRTLRVQQVSLGVGVTETRNAELALGSTSQTVEVTAHGEATLDTTDASIGNVIDTTRVQDLPSLIRMNAAVLLQLQPGVQVSGGDSQYGSVTGSRADTGNITLDGLDANDETIGQPFSMSTRAPIDSVQEVRTIVGGPDASYGRSSGAQIDLVTKSGTNSYHGSLFEYNRVAAYAANDWFNNLNDVARPGLIRNQFGGTIGGPIMKDKLFFFFNYEGRRDNIPDQVIRTVPLDALRNGNINYINSVPGCDGTARLTTEPQCISAITSSSTETVAGLDPAGIGTDTPLNTFIKDRYPPANDLSAGDGVNTGGYLFNSPLHVRENTFVGKLDYALTSKQKLFARGSWDRDSIDYAAPEFPADGGPLFSEFNHSRAWVVGHTWQITNALVNNASFGMARQLLDFPVNYAPTAPNSFLFGPVSGPYGDIRSQGRNVLVPEIRDTVSWSKKSHTWQFGADIKPIRVHSNLTADVNFVGVGLGGTLLGLNSGVRPTDINSDPGATQEWDSVFPFLLGRFNGLTLRYNADVAGNPLALFTPSIRDFAYNEYELYVADTWRIRSDLTLSYGLRWNYHSVPYEVNGFESVANLDLHQLFDPRVAAAAAGANGNDAAPLVSYNLGGPKNHGPGYMNPEYKDFAPTLGLAYSPSFTQGFLGRVFGDRKTSIRLGGGLHFDRILSTLSFEFDQQNWLFSNEIDTPFGSLAGDPRFTSLSAPPAGPAPYAISRPFTPNIDSGGDPVGLANGGFPSFFQLDRNLKTPYVISLSMGFQRELPRNFLVEVDYFGKLGRRLLADGDAAQTLNFKDPGSQQLLNTAFGAVQRELQNGADPTAVTMQPWFENQVGAAVAQNYGAACGDFFGGAGLNCTQLATYLVSNYFASNLVLNGDVSSTDLILSEIGFLLPNTGLLAQTGSAGYVGNYSASDYHSLLLSVRKKVSDNLQFDFDYAYAHGIDNVSDITNNLNQYTGTGQGLICDLTNLRTCRADSDFDARHTVSANYVYYLPVGRGQRFLGGASKWLDAIVGGWGTSGIVSWHTGYPFNTHTGTFPINFTQDAPAVFVGPSSNVKSGLHVVGGGLQYFANQSNALGAFTYPFGGGTGTRNPLHGPRFSNVDMALLKNFAMPWSDTQKLQFRAEAFNVFNHPSFDPPSAAINSPSEFGIISTTASTARQLQLALRFEF